VKRSAILWWGIVLLLIAVPVWADTGRLTAGDADRPGVISLERMEVRVRIDHGQAQVAIMQVFASHSDRLLEGRYSMIIPETADISGFAVWDGPVRIPGVIMERARAKQLFAEIERAALDPGLLESDDEPSVVNEFTARIFPLPPYGAKRLEMTYAVPAPIERGRLDFTLPLRPDEGAAQTAKHFSFDVFFAAGLPVTDIAFHGAHLVPASIDRSEQGFVAHYEAANVELDEDLSFTAELQLPDTRIDVVAFRDVEHVDWNISPTGGHYRDTTGYFFARLLFAPRESPTVGRRNVIFVVDGSLSMLGEKLTRTVELLGELSARLQPTDRASVLLANLQTEAMPGGPQPATADHRAALEQFLRERRLAGGIDLVGALDAAGELLAPAAANVVVLLSDGYPTHGELRPLRIVEAVKQSKLRRANARLFAVGVGDDANRTLLTDLAREFDGNYAWCADTADTVALAETVAARLAASVMRDVQLLFDEPANIVDAYPTQLPPTFAGSEAVVVGRYDKPGPLSLTLRYRPDDQPVQSKTVTVDLPDKATDHELIRRRWAKARVDHLLERIRREGEKQEWVDEIVALSKRFTFVTPYTSFLAAPRALLRPRVIRPGDPLLRVRVDQPVAAVTAAFPWGDVLPLTFLRDEDVWQVRFLAPPGYPDGEYACRLILRDRDGRQYVERKNFVLDGVAPTVKPAMPTVWRAGVRVRVTVTADRDTRRLLARLPFSASTALRWDASAQASVGYLELPAGAPPGPARLEVYAEDFAHNVSRTLIDVEVRHE